MCNNSDCGHPHRHSHHHPHHRRRHIAMVPRGFLKYKALKMLSERPMSGSEIMQELEEKSEGRWRPSPGSIYPLLAWLQDKKYIKEIPTREAGIKQYTITKEGKNFLQELEKQKEEIQDKMSFFAPAFFPPWIGTYRKISRKLEKPCKNLTKAMFRFGRQMQKQFSEETINEIRKIIEEATEKIEKITHKMKK